MNREVTRTLDILERILKEFPRPDALGGKKGNEWLAYSIEEYYRKSDQELESIDRVLAV